MGKRIEDSMRALRLAAEMSQRFYEKPLIITYSGGKDSSVLLDLAENCLKPNEFEVIHSLTTVDAPETGYLIKDEFKRLNAKGVNAEVKKAVDDSGKQITMWKLIPKKKIPPTRIMRYCCEVLKESGSPNRIVATGVRAEESVNRRGRDTFLTKGKTLEDAKYFSLEHAMEVYEESLTRELIWDCKLIEEMRKKNEIIVNPIYDWTRKNVWEYIRSRHLKVNPLYDRGYTRVGCIGCPMASYWRRKKEFQEYPKYKEAYLRAFEKMLEERKRSGLSVDLKSVQEVFDWWIEEYKHSCKGQITLQEWETEISVKA